MPLHVDIITAERPVYSGEVDLVVAPGVEGELGILPHHAPLLTALTIGELRLRKGEDEESLAIAGGFMEVLADKVIILADSAERSEEIDVARAEEARQRAQQSLADRTQVPDLARADATLRRSLVRLRVAQRRRRERAQP